MYKITIVLIENNLNDAKLIKELLEEINNFNYSLLTSVNIKEISGHINNNRIDLILLDLNFFDGTEHNSFDTILKYCSDIPIVLINSIADEELSLNLIKEGAQDYIIKQRLNSSLLDKVIRYSIERKKTDFALKKKSEELKDLNCHLVEKELKMIELKKEINELLKRIGEKERYQTT
jgi:DNA-binding NtrC family response regulator